MRIAQIAPVATSIPPPKSGSVELMTSLLTEGLIKRGIDVTLFATQNSVTKARLHSVYERGYWQDPQMWPWEFCEMINLSAACERATDFDLIHYQAQYYPMSLAFTRLVSTPFVQTVHHHPTPNQIKLWQHYPEANFVAISRCQAETMMELNCAGFVRHGVQTENFTFNPKPENYLLFLGRFMPEKGVLEAIEMARRLGVKLLLAAAENDYYREVVQKHVDGKIIVYVGEVEHNEKNKLLGGAAALVYPVQVGEPFGLVMIEAMACGTPVLAFDKGAVSEIVENGVNGFRAQNLDEVTKLYPQILNLDRAVVRRVAVERFGVERMVDQYIQIYEQIIEKSNLKKLRIYEQSN